jgi:sugar phosphate isomerase/epimerase
MSRRTFLAAAGSVAVGSTLAAQRPKRVLPLAFSTLGCPKWPWARVLEQAAQLGFSGIELRGIQMQMDLPKLPEFTGTRLAQSVKDLEALDLKITDLGASSRMHEADPTARAAQLDEGRRFVDLAVQLRAPYVRVFGDRIPAGQDRAAVVARVIEGLRTLGEHARGSGVGIIIEAHGDFTDSPTLLQILKGAAMDNVALLWDAHHTFVSGKEPPAKTFDALKSYVRHTHLKDSRPEGNGIRYVLTGAGTVPVRETVNILAGGGYKGFYCFEWEKGWHPEIEEPEVAFPHFVEKMREYLGDGAKAGGDQSSESGLTPV